MSCAADKEVVESGDRKALARSREMGWEWAVKGQGKLIGSGTQWWLIFLVMKMVKRCRRWLDSRLIWRFSGVLKSLDSHDIHCMLYVRQMICFQSLPLCCCWCYFVLAHRAICNLDIFNCSLQRSRPLLLGHSIFKQPSWGSKRNPYCNCLGNVIHSKLASLACTSAVVEVVEAAG